MSLRNFYHRRFGYHERFHVAVILTIVVVAYVVVPVVVRYIDALQGYTANYYEPKDAARVEWLQEHGVPEPLTGMSFSVVVDLLLFVLVGIVWLSLMQSGGGGRRSPPR